MTCPFYKNGVCTSPLLGGMPSHEVVREDVCSGDATVYTQCKYFVRPEGKGLEAFQPSAEFSERPYPLLHYLERRVESSCPEYKLMRHENVYVAYCRVLDRLLTKYEVENCEKHPETCPLRNYSVATARA